ncbi:FMN-binding protein [Aliiglaciecola sp. CAU 1673]|uniref:FMN-binding protein n=1 Tax=Aliiglaciecola sp. CAU 1673 TaxID=3032595 RepID=UPI0023DAC013|nr:FMN-binding protein [Aliiglaciecola sp. CAU 1673]MDF2177149.1 FMN-binding protein [Aliiglaciecola sp. CAU 1673]
MHFDGLNSLWLFPVAALSVPAYAVNYFSVSDAQQALFPGADTFIESPLPFSDDDKDRIKDLAGVRQRQDQQPIWRVQAQGQFKGWFIVDDVVGKHEYITYALALSPEGKVLGMEIMSYRETHGDKVRQANWRKQFEGKDVNAKLKLDEDIMNISGATLSCRNLTDGVKRLLVVHQQFLASNQIAGGAFDPQTR